MRITIDSRQFANTLKGLKTSRGKIEKNLPGIYRAVAFQTDGQYVRLSCNTVSAVCAESIPAITQDSGDTAADLDSVLTALTGVRGLVELSADGGKLTITQEPNTLLTCDTCPVSDLPVSPQYPDNPDTLTVDIADLRAALTQCVPVASTDTCRPILRGVYLECQDTRLTVVSTDTHRMVIRTISCDKADRAAESTAILPAEYAAALCKVLPKECTCKITFGERIWFQADGKLWCYRPTDGIYPDYRRVIPNDKDSASFAVSADAMIAALDGIAPIAQQDSGRVSIFSEGGSLTLHAHNGAGVESTRQVSAAISGSIQVCVNVAFLRSLLMPHAGTSAQVLVPEDYNPLSIIPIDSSIDSLGLLMHMQKG